MVEHVPFKLKSEFEPQGDQPATSDTKNCGWRK